MYPISFSLSLSLSVCLSHSLPLIERIPLPPSFLTCRECVSAIAACTDADTLPQAEAHKEVFNIDDVPLASLRRVTILSFAFFLSLPTLL